MAPFRLARLVMPDMELHGKGSIITVLSCAGFTPIPPQVAYGTSKAGLLMLTRYLAKMCAPHCRVNALCPGSMTADGTFRDDMVGLAAKNAIQRIGAADEATGAVLLLASDASSYTTGSTVFVEGGRVGTIA
jgi:NAD(P)-dependent dehydrogenase (short-subunit alcohol dehydrogenase family)